MERYNYFPKVPEGELQKQLSRGVRPAFQNPYSIYD